MSLTVKEIERLRENSKKGIKEGTGKINKWGTDASGYQKYYDSREIPVLKPLEDRVVKTEIKGKNATVPTSRLDLMRTLEAKRKESANQPIPSLKYNQATNSALKSKKQADSPTITNGNYVKDDKREYDVDRFNLGAQSDDKVIAGMTGALTSLPGFKSLVGVYDNLYEKATGNKGTSIDSINKTEEEHPIASTIGNAAGKIGQYAVGSQVMQSIPAVASLTGKAGQALSKFPLLSKVGAKPIANVLSDTMLDLGLDTLPSTVSDIQSGKSGGEVAGNALKNLGANLAFNIAGEGIGAGLKKIGSVNQAKKAISVDEIEALRKSVIPKVETPEVKVPEIINTIPKVEAPKVEVPKVEATVPKVEAPTVEIPKTEIPKETVSKMETTTSKALENLTSKLDPIEKNYAINSQALRQSMNEMLEKANRGEMTDADWEKIVSDISEGGSNIKNTLTGKQLVDDVATKENINKAKKTFNQVKKVTKKNQVYVDKDILREMGLSDKKKLEAANNWFGMNITKVPSGDNVITVSDFLKAIPDDAKAVMNVNVDSPKDSMKNVIDYMSSTFKNTMRKTKNDIPYSVYKNTDEEVGSIAREMNNYLDELNDIDKLAKQSIPTKEAVNQIPSLMPQASQVDNVVKEIPSLKPQVASDVFQPEIVKTKVDANGQMVMDVPVGKERGYAESIRTKTDLPDDIKNEFVDNPEVYNVLANADTKAKADGILQANTIEGAKSEFDRMLTTKDAAAIPLGYEISKKLIDAGKQNEAVELLRNMSKELTKSGQFTQAAAITMMKSDPMTSLRYMEREFDSINANGLKKFGNAWKPMSLTEAERTALSSLEKGDTEGIKGMFDQIGRRISKEYPATKWEKFVELTKFSMLFNPRTQARNVVSNAILSPVRSLTDRVSALGQNAVHLVNPDVKVTQSLLGGNKETKKVASDVWEQVKDSILSNSSKWNDLGSAVKNKQTFKGSPISKVFDKAFPGAIEKASKAMGKSNDSSLMELAKDFNYHLLEKGDDVFVKNNFVNRLASYMQAQGIKSVDDVPEDAISLATEEALKATFKDTNKFSEMLKNVKKNTGKFGEVMLPFTKTPANLAMRGIDYSPIGFYNSLKKQNTQKGVSAVIDDMSKNVVGTAGIAIGFALAKEGIIQGSLSDDKDEAAFQKQQGVKPYSININGSYYTYDWAQPSSTPLILGTTIYESMKESDKVLDKVLGAGIKTADSWLELSPLQSIADIFGGNGTVAENIMNEIVEFPRRLWPSAAGAVARTIDPTQRATYSNGNIVKTQIDTLKSKIPFVSKTLPATYDTWGNEVKRSDTVGEAAFAQMVNPGQFGNDNKTPIDDEIIRIYKATENKGVFPRNAAWKVGDIKLDNAQHSAYQEKLGKNAYKLSEAFIKSESFGDYDETMQAESIEKLHGLADAMAKRDLFGSKIGDTYSKLATIYEEQGEAGVIEYIDEGVLAQKLNVSREVVSKYKNDEDMLNAYSELDAISKKDKTNISKDGVPKSFSTSSNENKIEYMSRVNLSDEQKGELLYEEGESKKVDTLKDELGSEGVYKYYEIKKNAGGTSMAKVIPTLQNANMTDKEKGVYVEALAQSLSAGAKNAKAIYGNEGVYQYYLHKQLADADGNGSLKKSEVEQYLNYQKMADDMKATWQRLLTN